LGGGGGEEEKSNNSFCNRSAPVFSYLLSFTRAEPSNKRKLLYSIGFSWPLLKILPSDFSFDLLFTLLFWSLILNLFFGQFQPTDLPLAS